MSLLQSTVMSLSQQTVQFCQGSQPAKTGSPTPDTGRRPSSLLPLLARLNEVERKIIALCGEIDAVKSEDMLVAMPNWETQL